MEKLNKYFSSTLTKDTLNEVPEFILERGEHVELEDTTFSRNDIVNSINKPKIAKSTGPADIYTIILKESYYSIAIGLYLIFHKSIHHGEIPEDWK